MGFESPPGPLRSPPVRGSGTGLGNAITVDMPQDDGNSIPFDISVTACISSVEQWGILAAGIGFILAIIMASWWSGASVRYNAFTLTAENRQAGTIREPPLRHAGIV